MTDNITLPRATVEQALEALEEFTLQSAATPKAVRNWSTGRLAITALRTAMEQQTEPVAQRSDGMPISKTERELRRMLCIERHGRSAYMDDGEASFCGDKYCRSIDYMRESIESIRQAWYDAGAKKLAGAQPEQQAEPVADDMAEQLADALDSAKFYRRRVEALQSWQSKMRDPERIIVCDILANGHTLDPAFAGDRYTTQPQRKPLTDEEIAAIVRVAARGSAIKRDGSTSQRIARAIEAAHNIQEPKP